MSKERSLPLPTPPSCPPLYSPYDLPDYFVPLYENKPAQLTFADNMLSAPKRNQYLVSCAGDLFGAPGS